MKFEFNKLILVLAISATTAACTPSDDGSKKSEKREAPKSLIEQSACGVTPDEGNTSFNAFPSFSMKKSFFDKAYDQGNLNELMNLSLNRSIKFVVSQNVNLVRGEATAKASCTPFAVLPPAKGYSKDKWEESTKSKDGTEIVVLGLYLEKGQPGVAELKDQASIVIRPDTSRWTLVHEYMHHLFTDANQKQGSPTYELKEKFFDASGKNQKIMDDLYYDKLVKGISLNTDEANSLAQALLDYIGDLYELMKRYPMEEVTVESYLIEKYKEQKFVAVPDVDVVSAAWYVHSKYELSKEFLIDSEEKIGNTLDAIGYKIDETLRENLKHIYISLKSSKLTIDNLNEVALTEAKKRGRDLENERVNHIMGLVADHSHPEGHCSHSAESKLIEKMANNFINRKE